MIDINFINALLKADLFEVSGPYIRWHGYQFTQLPGWPDGLDTENFEITKIYNRGLYGWACGDWQAMTKFQLEFEDNALHLYPFMEPDREDRKDSIKKIEKEIIDCLGEPTKENSLHESKGSDEKELNEAFDQFNKDYFDNKLPKVEIKITNKTTDNSKGVAGSFNFHDSIHSNENSTKHYKLKDLRKKSKRDDTEERAFDYIVSTAYIELPKDVVKKGKYYYASVLLHEMAHEYVELCTKSNDSDPHGKTFRQTVDAINKKSNNEWRVAYEEVPIELVSDKKLDKRPEGLDED